jgi:hypothetical protein
MTSISITTTALPKETAGYLTGLLKRKLMERTEVNFPGAARECDWTIRLELDPTIGEEGYRIHPGDSQQAVAIAGNDPLGLLHGIGRLLRTAEYEWDNGGRGFRPGAWQGTSVPQRKVRGMYFATHFRNFYHRAPIEEVEAYIEDLALWGYNAITVWFDRHHYTSIHDAEAQAMIARLHSFLQAAHRIGMKPGLLVLGNEGYNDSPLDLRADWTTDHDGYFHDLPMYHVEVCPSKPAGFRLIMQQHEEVFAAFADLPLEYVWIWPWDQGGCSCPDCAPWGGNGFLKIARPAADLARQFFPQAKIILSTWYFDCYTHGEWQTFADRIKPDHAWIDYIMAEFPGKFPDYILQNGVPGGLPLLGFPEISMFQCAPWGGYGANPLPGYIQKMWDEAGSQLAGGFPYSEGIFEDINKAIVAMYYWQGHGQPQDAILEYANYAFSSRFKGEIARAVHMLETSNRRERRANQKKEWMPPDTQSVAEEQFVIADTSSCQQAFDILEAVDGQLAPAQRSVWRWRILYLRGLIDNELARHDFRATPACEDAFAELIRIYHAQEAIWAVRPPAKADRVIGWH